MSEMPSEDCGGSAPCPQSLQRALRAHRTISASNRTLLRASDEGRLVHDMCTVAVEHGGYVRAGVIFAEHGPDRLLRWVAWVGRDEHGRAVAIDVGELNAAGYTWADTPLGQDATAIAIRTGRPFTRRDVLSGPVFADPAYAALRKRAEEGGYLSLTAFPLADEAGTIGALFMAAAEPDAFDEQEIGLLAELADDLTFGIRTLRLRRAHEEARATIQRLTLFDRQTDLPNRAGLLQALRERIDAGGGSPVRFAVLYIGVEKFHEIGNALGQECCARLMQVLAERIASRMPPGSLVALPGEGELAVVLDGADEEQARRHARAALAVRAEPVEASSALIDPRIAAGIALFPDHAGDADSLVRRAGAAMHLAQRSAQGLALYRAGHEQEIAARLALMGRLRRAIDAGEFELFCQPKVDMRTCRPCGAEALIRWRDPVQGLIGPATFIPLAEQGGLISAITEWVIEAAFRQVHDWRSAGSPLSLSVNLSAHDLQNPALIEHIRKLAATWQVPGDAIQFELTESALMDDPDTAMQSLVRLNDMGFDIWIDDFGTGYSSLGYLQRFPIHAIKIDQSFVRPMHADSGSNAIVRATIDLGHHLGLHVIAEGVEDLDAWTDLGSHGCDVAQGYFVSPPMPVAEFADWSRNWRLA